MGKPMGLEKEKLVGSLIFVKNGHLAMSCWKPEESSLVFLEKKSILLEEG